MPIDVSIIVTNYNNAKYLGVCLRSCLNQSMPKESFEIIVVDDGSTDNSKKLLSTFKDKVKTIYLKKNRGVAYASNVGVKAAVGQYIIRVDSDDYISKDLIYFLSEILRWNLNVGFAYCDLIEVDEFDNAIRRIRLDHVENLFNHGAGMMFRKSHLETIGLYDEKIKNCEDYDLILRYFKNFDGYYLKIPLYKYRKHKTNMTKDEKGRKKWKETVLRKNKLKRR